MAKETLQKMTKIVQKYKGFTITTEYEQSLGGETLLYYSVFRDKDEWGLESSFTSGNETLLHMSNLLRNLVDEYLLNSQDYE